MAVQSDTSRISYTGNNSTVTSYAVPFYFLENSHLSAIAKVTATGVETVVTLTNHTGAGDQNGGTVRTAVAVPATSTLTISRTVPATQTTTYQEGGDFPAASHERALDKLTMATQQIARSIARTVRLSDAAPESSPLAVLPNRFFGTDNNGNIALVTGTDAPAGSLTNANIASDADIALSKLATGALPTGITVADANVVNGAAIALSKLATGALPTAITVAEANLVNNAVTASKLASTLDLSGKTLTLPDGNIATAKIADAAVTPAKLSQPYTLATSVASTSGTSIDFTGIPSWAKRITVMFSEVSTNGTNDVLVQLGDAGGIENTGYVSTSNTVNQVGGTAGINKTDGFAVVYSQASHLLTGHMLLTRISGNTWVSSHTGKLSTASVISGAGSKTLSDTLTQVRITTVNGTDTFDAGEINISYEG